MVWTRTWDPLLSDTGCKPLGKGSLNHPCVMIHVVGAAYHPCVMTRILGAPFVLADLPDWLTRCGIRCMVSRVSMNTEDDEIDLNAYRACLLHQKGVCRRFMNTLYRQKRPRVRLLVAQVSIMWTIGLNHYGWIRFGGRPFGCRGGVVGFWHMQLTSSEISYWIQGFHEERK